MCICFRQCELLTNSSRPFDEDCIRFAEFADPEMADLLVFGSVGFLVGEVSADVQPGILRARVFAGYSGWGPGQLEGEMAQGVWLTAPSSREAVFGTRSEDLWEYAVRSLGIEPATLITTNDRVATGSPNIVIITVDTLRADHLELRSQRRDLFGYLMSKGR